MLLWRSGYAGASKDAAKQMRSAALNRSNDVRNCGVQKILEKGDRLCRGNRGGALDDADGHHSCLGVSSSSIMRFSKRAAPPPSILR